MDNRTWLREKGWGLFIHYLESLQNNPETPNNQGAGRTSWEACVNQLDVERLAQDAASAGAGYLVFTLQQQTRFACAPNPVYDRLSGSTKPCTGTAWRCFYILPGTAPSGTNRPFGAWAANSAARR